MSFNGRISGIKLLDNSLGALVKNIEKGKELAVQEATLELHAEAVRVVGENQGGSTVVRYNPKRKVSVSDPFEPPHKDKGRLQKSIKFNFSKGQGEVGTNYKVGAWLEFGTEHTAPRPWLSVAVERTSKKVAQIFEKWLSKGLKGDV